jgi:hypothetical protein
MVNERYNVPNRARTRKATLYSNTSGRFGFPPSEKRLGHDGGSLKKIGIGRDNLRPSGVLLAAIRPCRLDGDGRRVRWSVGQYARRNVSKQLSPMRNMVLKGSAEMKQLLASLTLGACLLLPSAGVVLGAGPPTKPAQNPTTGQHGSNHGFSCTTSGAGIDTPGNAISAQGSPFNPTGQAGTVYAGNPGTASATNANSTAAVSQYDVACSHQMP